MKNTNMILGMMAMFAGLEGSQRQTTRKRVKKPVKKVIPKGVNKYYYGEEYVMARDQKNADRKARNKGLI